MLLYEHKRLSDLLLSPLGDPLENNTKTSSTQAKYVVKGAFHRCVYDYYILTLCQNLA